MISGFPGFSVLCWRSGRASKRAHANGRPVIVGNKDWPASWDPPSSGIKEVVVTTPQFHPPALSYPPVDTRPEVKVWQQQMRKRGWHIAVDGKFGKESRRLCANFEMEHGLTSNGDVDEKTWKATWEAGSTKPKTPPNHTLKKGDKGPDVEKWQRQVNNRGFPDLLVDGDFGSNTQDICKKFQEFKGLPVTGEIDTQTWKEAWLEKVPVAAAM
jgi:peptidoglycan hydrolase-like protein with peptidoglycan-binding domain